MQPVTLHARPSRLLLLFVGCLVGIALGLLLVHIAHEATGLERWFKLLLGVAAILFALAGAVVAVRQLFDRRPRIIIDDTGIFDRTLKTPVIPWTSILSVSLAHVQHQRFIALELLDEDERAARLSAIHRWMTAGNKALGFGRFNLNLTALAIPAEQLLEIIAEHMASVSTEPKPGSSPPPPPAATDPPPRPEPPL